MAKQYGDLDFQGNLLNRGLHVVVAVRQPRDPDIDPRFIGQMWINTDTTAIWQATGPTTWTRIDGGGGVNPGTRLEQDSFPAGGNIISNRTNNPSVWNPVLAKQVNLGAGGVTDGSAAAVLGGEDNSAIGFASLVAGGYENIANGIYSAILGGRENSVTNSFGSVTGGRENLAAGLYSEASGFRATADLYGERARAVGRFFVDGDMDISDYILYNRSHALGTVNLYLNGSTLELDVPLGRAVLVRGVIIGREYLGDRAIDVEVRALVVRQVSGTLSIVYQNIQYWSRPPGTYTVSLSAPAGGTLRISATVPSSADMLIKAWVRGNWAGYL